MDKEAWCAAVHRLQRVGDNLVTEQQQLTTHVDAELYTYSFQPIAKTCGSFYNWKSGIFPAGTFYA